MIRLLLKSFERRCLTNDATTEGYFRVLVKNASKSNDLRNQENLIDAQEIEQVSRTNNYDPIPKVDLKNNFKNRQKSYSVKKFNKKSSEWSTPSMRESSEVNTEWAKAKQQVYQPPKDPRESIKVDSIEEYLEVEDRLLDQELERDRQRGKTKRIPMKLDTQDKKIIDEESLFAQDEEQDDNEEKAKYSQSQMIFKLAAEQAHELNLKTREKTQELVEQQTDENDIETIIKNLRPAHRPFAYNLAYFVNDSQVLKKFIEMGIPIKEWDKDRSVAEFMLSLNFEKHVAPYLIFFHNIGLKAQEYARIIHKNPLVLKETLDDLRVRVEYLESKKFTRESIALILFKSPTWLSFSADTIDANLGWFQREFNLKAADLRLTVTKYPELITKPLKIASDMKFYLKEILGFDEEQTTHMIKQDPKLFGRRVDVVGETYKYLSDVAKFTNQQIVDYTEILRAPLYNIKSRFAFLKALKLNQFDPTKPNYVSLKDLVDTDDKYFCTKVAKSSIQEYEKFLKNL